MEYATSVVTAIRDTNAWYLGKLQKDHVSKIIRNGQLLTWVMHVHRRSDKVSVLPVEVAEIISGYIGDVFLEIDDPLTAERANALARIERARLQTLMEQERKLCMDTILRIYVEIVMPQIQKHIQKGRFEGCVCLTPLHLLPLRYFSSDAKLQKTDLDLLAGRIAGQGFEVLKQADNRNRLYLKWGEPPEHPGKRRRLNLI